DVVLGTAPASAGRRALVVGGVGRDIAARGEAVAVAPAGAVAGAEELDRVGDDADRLPFPAPVFRFPLPPIEAAFDRDRPALREVIGAVLALRAPDGDVEIVGLVLPLTGLAVLAAAVDGDPQLADRGPSSGAAQLGIAGQVPRDDDYVDVRSCHDS